MILTASACADETEEERAANWLLIFPGTKWCGAGNIAENENDLGVQVETDKCCRAHDFCDDIIDAGARKHNLTNTAPYTRLNCRCDNEFYKCLKNANTKASNKVGYIYFNVLGTQCFREDYPIVRCLRRGRLPRRQCQQYEYDITKDMIYQWFDVQDY
ncbi:hypothetical protein FQR65_LT03489 [Abscondita terminalis]|nr:hypothetical protein FQR65_LT03489 [Abscondita terminalis]